MHVLAVAIIIATTWIIATPADAAGRCATNQNWQRFWLSEHGISPEKQARRGYFDESSEMTTRSYGQGIAFPNQARRFRQRQGNFRTRNWPLEIEEHYLWNGAAEC